MRQIGCALAKASFCHAHLIILAFARISQKRCCDSLDFRENPRARGFAANRLFSLFALIATRQRTAGGALYLPPSPRTLVAPLPRKSHTASRVAIFGGPVIEGSLIIERAQIHSFRICPSAYRGQKRKLRFPFLRDIILIIYRASRITFLRQRTQFADTSAHGRGEAAAF